MPEQIGQVHGVDRNQSKDAIDIDGTVSGNTPRLLPTFARVALG